MGSGQRRWNLNVHYHGIILESIPAGATTALDIGSGNGLLSFDLAEDGSVVYTNGSAVFRLEPGGRAERVVVDRFIEQVVAL